MLKQSACWAMVLGAALMVLAWPHLFFKGQVPVDGNTLRLFYPNWTFLHAHPPTLFQWPLWNPYRNMGEPFLADPQSLAAYPPMWLLCRIPNYLSFMRLWIVGHTLLAGTFMALWMKAKTGDTAAAAASAIVISINGYFTAHATLPTHFASAAYLPVVLYCFDRGHLVGLAFALALQWLAGFPPFSILTGLVLVTWAILSGTSQWTLLWKGSVLALGLAAFQLIPFAELFLHASRPLLLGSSAAVEFSEPWPQLFRLLFVPQWFAHDPQLVGDQAVVSFYVGPFVLFTCAWAALKGGKRERLVLSGVLFCLALSLGSHLPGYAALSWLRVFRFPANWLFLAAAGMALLSGLGISQIPVPRWKWLAMMLILVDLLAFAQYVRVPWFRPAFLEAPPLVKMLGPLSRTSRVYHSPIVVQALDHQEVMTEADYVFLKDALAPSYGMAFGLREVSSYQVLKLTRALRYQQRLAAEGPSSPLLRWAGVSTVITRQSGPEPWGPGNIQVVSLKDYQAPMFFRGRDRLQRIDVLSSAAGGIKARVRTPQSDLLIFSEVAYPGWRVTVDGKAISVALFEDTFLAVPVPSGEHEVEFRYIPRSFRIGLGLSVGAGLLVVGLCVFPLSRQRKSG